MLRNWHPQTNLHPSRLEHPTSCARSRLVPSHRACTMICMVDVWSCALGVRAVWSMCGHVLLVFVGSRLTWVANVSHLCTPVVKSRLSILHVFIVRLTVQLVTVLVTCRTQHTVTVTLFSTALIRLRLTAPVRLDLSSTLTLPAVTKVSCCS